MKSCSSNSSEALLQREGEEARINSILAREHVQSSIPLSKMLLPVLRDRYLSQLFQCFCMFVKIQKFVNIA